MQRQRRMESIQKYNSAAFWPLGLEVPQARPAGPAYTFTTEEDGWWGREGPWAHWGADFPDPLGLSAAVFRKPPSSALCFPSLQAPSQGRSGYILKELQLPPCVATPSLHTSSYHPDSGKAGSR